MRRVGCDEMVLLCALTLSLRKMSMVLGYGPFALELDHEDGEHLHDTLSIHVVNSCRNYQQHQSGL